MGPKPTCQRDRNSVVEEHPNVPTLTGSRTFQYSRQADSRACRENSRRVVLPTGFVKIHGEEEARFVQQHRINARNEISSLLIPPGKMRANHLVRDRQKLPVLARRALHSGLLADPAQPLITTNWRIP